MSDIALQFPPWLSLALLGVEYWFLLVAAALALGAAGWFGRRLPKMLRYIAWVLAAACVAPLLLLLVLVAADAVGPRFGRPTRARSTAR